MSSALEFAQDPGGVFGAKSSRKASEAQAKSAREANVELARQFDLTRGDLRPQIEAGNAALNQQRILLGLGASDPFAERRAEIQNEINTFQNAEMPDIGFGGSGAVSKLMRRIGTRAQQEGQNSRLTELQQELEGLGPAPQGNSQEQQERAFAAFNESPGQKFMRDRAQKNLIRNQSAIGGLGGGNVRSALVEQGAGFAQQDFQNQFGRLGQVAGQGQAGAVQLGQFGQNVSSEKGANLRASADARASGIMAQQQSKSNMLGTAATVAGAVIASDCNLKTNVKKVGTLESGAGWYTWDWKEFAKSLVGDQIGEGVMAQEYRYFDPDAVVIQNGYLAVNYGMVH